MRRLMLNTILLVLCILLFGSLYKILSGRAEENVNVAKLVGILNQEKSVHAKLEAENVYYMSSEYLESVSRDDLGLAGKGEYIVVLPSVVTTPVQEKTLIIQEDRPSFILAWVHLLIS